jgi:predicted RNA-binding Zn-ribbon protein involved in translation (DUF1610 family)
MIQLDDSFQRVAMTYECPECGASDWCSPTYRERLCTRCGERGHETEWAAGRTEPCPECGDETVKTHENGAFDGFTCRSCYTGFVR